MYLGTGHKEFGADMNIRGGQKGFMRSLAFGRFLAWPDYVGHPWLKNQVPSFSWENGGF